MYLIVPLFIGRFCNHNENEQAQIDKSKILLEEDYNSSQYTWGNIRIQLDTSLLYREDNDKYICKRVGQVINNLECQENDIFTSEKRNALVKSLESMKEFAERTFKVQQIPNNTFEVSYQVYGFEPKEVSNVDLYIYIVPVNTKEEQIHASATIFSYEYPSKRAREGAIKFNSKLLPTSPVLYNTWENSFFYTCLHELCHLLGFTKSQYDYFHPVDSFTPYSNPLCTITRKGKQFTFLTTPYCHKFAVKHFNMEYFEGDNGERCLSGIELEDGDGSQNSLSHLETRTYMTEFMLPTAFTNYRFSRFTDATAAVLLDTGNYIINYSNLQPLLWGNKESFDGVTYIKNFPIDPPQKVFPENYIVKDEDGLEPCGFDYKFFGLVYDIPAPDCSKPATSQANFNISEGYIAKYCQGKDFYNPNDEKSIHNGTLYADFTRFKFPQVTCPEGTATLPYVNQCLKYKFISDDEIKFESTSFDFSCYRDSNPDKKRWVYTVKYKCPDFERFKRTVQLYDSFFNSDPFSDDGTKYYYNANVDSRTVDMTPVPTLPLINKIVFPLSISLGIFSFILIIAIIFISLYKCGYISFKRGKNSDDESSWVPQSSTTESSGENIDEDKEYVIPGREEV